jgi:hypothetical protein
MRWHLGAVLALAALLCPPSPARADDAAGIVDKAIKAAGGEARLSKIAVVSVKSKGVITINGEENPVETRLIFQGLDRVRSEFEGTFGGNDVKGITVINGDKGWRKFGDNSMELTGDQLAAAKRVSQLSILTALLLPLKGKDYKLETAGEEKIGNSPAVGVKVTTPDGKDFTLFFDKESGLPSKLIAKVPAFMGEETVQQTIMTNYKEFDGIKRATKMEITRDGQPFSTQETSEVKFMDKADPGTFDEP